MRHKRPLILLLLSGLFFIFIHFLISHIALSSFSTLTVVLNYDHDDRVVAYYSPGSRTAFSGKRMLVSNVIPAGTKTRSVLKLRGHLARKLRIDPGDKTGHVMIYSLILTSDFGPPITFTPADIHKRFTPNNAIRNYSLETDHLSFEITGKDPQLVLKDELIVQNWFISIVLPVVFTFAFYLAISHFGRSSFPAFYDLMHHKSSANLIHNNL